jgi:hypothetical protein
MKDWVSEWVQEGRLYVWRYADPNRGWRGWHFTADPAGCRSMRNLLDRMNGGEQRHRTLSVERVTEAILSVPNYGHKTAGSFSRLRVAYMPEQDDLQLSEEDGGLLIMTVGHSRLRRLSAAFADVEVGGGDFGIGTSDDRKAETWMFWSMPDVRYNYWRQS